MNFKSIFCVHFAFGFFALIMMAHLIQKMVVTYKNLQAKTIEGDTGRSTTALTLKTVIK